MSSASIASILLLAVIFAATSDGAQFEKLLVLHRHGARTPMGVVNGSLFCQFPFCQLTTQGKEMCRSLGRYIGDAYNTTGLLNLPPIYNVSFMSSEGTDFSRVVVSGEAVVMGLYENSTIDALPFVDYKPAELDVNLVMWKSWPTWIIRNTYDVEVHVDDAWVRAFIGDAHLTQLGETFGIQEICATSPTDCVGFVQDSIACNVSSGEEVPQWAYDRWDDYRVVVSRFLGRLLGYDPTDNYDLNVGSFGYPLLSDAFSGFFSSTATGLLQLQHYAAHDWTLIAVYSALGIWTPADSGNTTFVPRFTETLLLEQWSDGGEMFIKARWGYPNQTAASNHTFMFRDANMSCMRADGTVYSALASVSAWCPLADVWRFVNSTGPQSEQGICYATDEMLKSEGCNDDQAPPSGSRCLFYRQQCPAVQCGETNGAIADPARGFMCQAQQLGKDIPFMAATVVALVAPALLGGAIGGFYFANKLRDFFWSFRKDSVGEQQPLAQEK